MKSALITLSLIDIPDDVERDTSRIDDDLLTKSIAHGGIQQPLVVLANRKRYTLVDGLRRIRAAQTLSLAKLPVVIDEVPEGQDPDEYRRRIRFILDQHRQDLLPSQKAELIETLKKMFGMNQIQVAAYLGVNQDTITNWMAVKKYLPTVVSAIDAGQLTMQSARVFDGMSEEGQKQVWKAHAKELTTMSGGKTHKVIRAKYSPQTFPTYYHDAKMVSERLARKSGKRKATKRFPAISANEKRTLLGSVEMKEIELRDAQDELKALKAEINAAIPIVGAIMRNEKLLKIVPDGMIEELERFAEVYV